MHQEYSPSDTSGAPPHQADPAGTNRQSSPDRLPGDTRCDPVHRVAVA